MTCDVQELSEFPLATFEHPSNAVPYAPPRPFLFSLIAWEDLMALQPVGHGFHENPLFYWAFVERTKSARGSVEKREAGG